MTLLRKYTQTSRSLRSQRGCSKFIAVIAIEVRRSLWLTSVLKLWASPTSKQVLAITTAVRLRRRRDVSLCETMQEQRRPLLTKYNAISKDMVSPLYHHYSCPTACSAWSLGRRQGRCLTSPWPKPSSTSKTCPIFPRWHEHIPSFHTPLILLLAWQDLDW